MGIFKGYQCVAIALFVLEACTSPVDKTKETIIENDDILNTQVLTKEQQDALTPMDVLERLKQGNEDFFSDQLTVRNNSGRVREAALGQHPKAIILSCIDSRVPVEDVFHKGIGDLFVARVAGNIVNEDILGSLEYGCKVSGSKLIVVLGHEYCGAIKSAIDGVQLGNITALLSKIRPAVTLAKSTFKGEMNSKNEVFVDTVCVDNVKLTILQIRKESAILKEMEDKGQIKIVGMVYNIKTGKVVLL
ncbi:MAG TPA: carbonic anhydrase family protein [Arachidicoccus sp.]